MEINIKNPSDQSTQRLEVQPEDYKEIQALRIIFPDKGSFVMAQQQGGA